MSNAPASFASKYEFSPELGDSVEFYRKVDIDIKQEIENKRKPIEKDLLESQRRSDIALEEFLLYKTKHEQQQCLDQLNNIGINKYKIFEKNGIPAILNAIRNRDIIEEINIAQAVKDPKFRFFALDAPLESLDISNTLAALVNDIKSLSPHISKMGRQKKTENADDFAKGVYKQVSKLQKELNLSSFRQAAKELNDRKIFTSKGSCWHAQTIIDLTQRWEKLGLDPIIPKPE